MKPLFKLVYNLVFFCVLLILFACQTEEPPFEVQTAPQRRLTMIPGFGQYVLTHPKADKVLVHRETYTLNDLSGELPVDLYYPPGYRFKKPLPAVVVVGGNINWSSSITLAELLSGHGFLTIVPETLDMVKQDTPDPLASLISHVLEDAPRLFIDSNRLAIWSEGHPSSLALQVAMDRQHDFHDSLRAAVFASPVMTFGKNNFDYDPAWISPQLPVLITQGEEDSLYEVKTSIKLFMKAAASAASAAAGAPAQVTHLKVPGGNHNWMTEQDTKASREAIRTEIEFLEKHL